jgi:hypothetical protein
MARARASSLRAITAAALFALAAAVDASPAQDFAARFEEAERLRARAALAGYEWLETADLLQEARQRHEAGELQQASQLLQQGMRQAERALEQAEREAEAWRRRVVR